MMRRKLDDRYLAVIRDAMNMVLLRAVRGSSELFTLADVTRLFLMNGFESESDGESEGEGESDGKEQ